MGDLTNNMFQLGAIHLEILLTADLVDQINSHQYRFGQKLSRKFTFHSIYFGANGLLYSHPCPCVKGFSRQIDNTGKKLIERIWMHKYLDHPALIDLPDTYGSLGQDFTVHKEQFIPRMKV